MILHFSTQKFFTTREICQQVDLSLESLQEMVEQGIAEPRGERPAEWVFSLEYAWTIRRAVRLHRDLGLDWAGVALVLELLDERERLRAENSKLLRRLQRFERVGF